MARARTGTSASRQCPTARHDSSAPGQLNRGARARNRPRTWARSDRGAHGCPATPDPASRRSSGAREPANCIDAGQHTAHRLGRDAGPQRHCIAWDLTHVCIMRSSPSTSPTDVAHQASKVPAPGQTLRRGPCRHGWRSGRGLAASAGQSPRDPALLALDRASLHLRDARRHVVDRPADDHIRADAEALPAVVRLDRAGADDLDAAG